MNEVPQVITQTSNKELSEPMKKLIRFLARVAVDEYIEEERQKAKNNSEQAVTGRATAPTP